MERGENNPLSSLPLTRRLQMKITQRTHDTIGDLIELHEKKIQEENKDKPEWVTQEIVNELWELHEFLYDKIVIGK
jgi:arsenate reductase-like glutaredoxin family protein